MKPYNVYMFDLAVAPLNGTNSSHPAKTAHFDHEDEAIAFAKSERKNWGQVTVHKSDSKEEIVSFHGDVMYVGNHTTRLKEDE